MPDRDEESTSPIDDALLALDEAMRRGDGPPEDVPAPGDLDWRAADELAACQRCLLELKQVWSRQQGSLPPGRHHSMPKTEETASTIYDWGGLAGVGPGTELGPFLILEELGRGGMGIVYKALDRRQHVHVALKMLTEEGDAAVRRIKHEFRVLAEIVHPNLVVLEELYLVDQQWFFTMELVEGQPFADYVRGDNRATAGLDSRSRLLSETCTMEAGAAREALPRRAESAGEPMPPGSRSASGTYQGFPPLAEAEQFARLRSALAQVADGLAALHQAGILHRDIKPSNVLVTADGRVVLVDFGLAADVLNQAAPGGHGVEPAGTWGYMAPEQSAGEPLSAASDWYSVGVMLWEVLAGQRPFEGVPEEILRKKRAGPPPLEAGVVPAEHADLAALCRQLLQPEVAARPSEEVILEQLRPATPGKGPTRHLGVSGEPVFVGRREPSQRLMKAYAQSKQGQTNCTLVHGAPGIGKTALVEHFLQQIEREGDVLVLRGRCYERESVPYEALDSIVDDLAERLAAWPQAEVAALFSASLGPLLQVFPELGRIVVTSREAREDVPREARETRRLAIEALRGLLCRLAARRPMVLVVDDLQWGDADGAVLLGELFAPPDPPPLLLIACYRSEEAAANRSLQGFLAGLQNALPGGHSHEIALGPLSAEETRQLTERLFEQDHRQFGAGRAPIGTVVEQVVQESSGNPYYVGELVRHTLRAPGREPGRADLETIVSERVGQLPGPAQQLLDLVAVAGHPVRYLDACLAVGTEPQPRLLVQLGLERLVRTSGEGVARYVEPYHDRVRETVAAALSEEERREHHRQLAMVLEASSGGDPQLLFTHFDAADDRGKAAQYALRAANQAVADLAFEQAARLYRRAFELDAVVPDQAHVVRKRLADALADAGHGVEAAAEYQAAALGFSGTAALQLRRRAAEFLLRAGRLDDGREVLRGVLAAVGLRMPRSGLEAKVMAFWDLVRLRLRGSDYRERSANEIAPEELLRIDTCRSGAVMLITDALLGLPFATRFPLLALEAGEPYRVSLALVHLAVVRAWSERRQDVADIFRRAESAAQRLQNSEAHGYVHMNMGYVHAMRGEWRRALRCSDEALAILGQESDAVRLDRSSTQLAVLASLFFLGEIRELTRRLPQMLEEARRWEDPISASVPHTYFGNVAWLATDDVERARRGACEVLARFPQDRLLQQHVFELIGSLQIDLYLADGRRAWERLAQAWRKYRKSFYASNPLYRPVLHHLRARAALASVGAGQNNRALIRSALRDAKRPERERAAWCDPLAWLVRAGVAAVQRDEKTAVGYLRQAIPQFESAEMALFAAVARRRLGELLGGEEGRDLVRQADDWMEGEGIRVPWRFAAMLAPGFGGRG